MIVSGELSMQKITKTYKIPFSSSVQGSVVDLIVVPTLIWHHPKRGDIDEFIVNLAIANDSLRRLGYHKIPHGSSWAEVAHSDHNPVGGHDIYNPRDSKQLHVDVNDPYNNGYTTVYKKLASGSPPRPVGTAADSAKEILFQQSDRFLNDFLP